MTAPERVDVTGWWWKGHTLGYADAAGDRELYERHAADALRVAELPDEDVEDIEDWWSGYSSGWEAATGRDLWEPGS